MGRFQKNPSIGWVHSNSTHVPPLTWGSIKQKKLKINCPQILSPNQSPLTAQNFVAF